MKFAFCFLTYTNIVHTKQWQSYFEGNSIYIHPKNRDAVDSAFQQYILPTLLSTAWGDRSIVDATVLLLEQAIKDSENAWFILCSEDSCPLKPYAEFRAFFEQQTLSIFEVMDARKDKTSQWWALCRRDVEILLRNKMAFSPLIEKISKQNRKQAIDELFFLRALKQFQPQYQFTDGCVHYVKWFSEWVSKHPTVFNRLLEEDAVAIDARHGWFIRKTFPTFEARLVDKKPACIILCLGSNTSTQYEAFLEKVLPRANLFLLVMDATVLPKHALLTQKCEQAYYAVWNMVEKASGILRDKFSALYGNENGKVTILDEAFDYKSSSASGLEGLPVSESASSVPNVQVSAPAPIQDDLPPPPPPLPLPQETFVRQRYSRSCSAMKRYGGGGGRRRTRRYKRVKKTQHKNRRCYRCSCRRR